MFKKEIRQILRLVWFTLILFLRLGISHFPQLNRKCVPMVDLRTAFCIFSITKLELQNMDLWN